MNLLESLENAIVSLRVHKLRSGLTALGIVIGTAATVAMLAVGAAARAQVAAQVRSLGANLLVVVPGNVQQTGVRLGSGATPTLTDEDAASIRTELPTVQFVSALIVGRIQIVADGANWATTIYGVESSFLAARDWEVVNGTAFGDEELIAYSQVALLGQTVARELFGNQDPIGREVRVRNVPFRVIGTLASKGQTTSGQDQDDAVVVPMSAGRRVLGRNQAKALSVSGIVMRVFENESLAAAAGDARVLLRQRHRIQPQQDDDFVIRNLTAVEDVKEAGARTLSILLASIAIVSLVTGGIGILNIMLVAVTERTREIGIRLAVGARPRDIRLQFLLEATVLSIFGGVIGIVVGLIGSWMIVTWAEWVFMIEPWSVISAVTLSVLVGIFFGWYPAMRAAQLEPIEAIRVI